MSRYCYNACLLFSCLLAVSSNALAAVYNITSGQYPPCSTSWSVSGTTYSCQNNGRVSLSNGDQLTANTNITLSANNGFNFSSAAVGNNTNRINLTAGYGSIDISGPTTIYGNITAGSSTV